MLDPRTPYSLKAKNQNYLEVVLKATTEFKEGHLCFYSSMNRGHSLKGRIKKQLDDGIIFESDFLGEITLKPLTMREFDKHVRPLLDEHESSQLQTLDDVYFWYRRQNGIV